MSQNGFGFLIIYRVCMPHIIHRFSPPGHPHCLAIILVTQTNVEMMMAFGSIFVVFYEGVFPCQKSVSTTLSFVLSITRIFGGLPCVARLSRQGCPSSCSGFSLLIMVFPFFFFFLRDIVRALPMTCWSVLRSLGLSASLHEFSRSPYRSEGAAAYFACWLPMTCWSVLWTLGMSKLLHEFSRSP